MSSFVDMAATRVTQVRASLVCGRERQAAFEACTTGGNLHITTPKATVDTAGIAWRLIVHDWSIARRTRLLQRSCTLFRSTASMEFGHTYRLGAYTPTRERREMKSTAQLSTLSQPPVRPFEGTGSHHLGIPSVHLMRPSNTRSTKVAQLSAPERSEASPT